MHLDWLLAVDAPTSGHRLDEDSGAPAQPGGDIVDILTEGLDQRAAEVVVDLGGARQGAPGRFC